MENSVVGISSLGIGYLFEHLWDIFSSARDGHTDYDYSSNVTTHNTNSFRWSGSRVGRVSMLKGTCSSNTSVWIHDMRSLILPGVCTSGLELSSTGERTVLPCVVHLGLMAYWLNRNKDSRSWGRGGKLSRL